jgi:antitoxin ParD1/3/4
MNFSLPPAMESFIRKQVKSGRYGNASEVIRDGLRLLIDATTRQEQELAALKREIDKGLKSGTPIDEDVVFRHLKTARARRLKARNGAR